MYLLLWYVASKKWSCFIILFWPKLIKKFISEAFFLFSCYFIYKISKKEYRNFLDIARKQVMSVLEYFFVSSNNKSCWNLENDFSGSWVCRAFVEPSAQPLLSWFLKIIQNFYYCFKIFLFKASRTWWIHLTSWYVLQLIGWRSGRDFYSTHWLLGL